MRPLAIVGPTGTGKSQLALDVVERLGGQAGAEIVNADAMQFYRGMDIGTAKLPVAQRRGIPHHQLDVLDVTETATVARYQQAAAADIEAIAAGGAVPVMVGGSMLYIQSLLDDWSFPATDPVGAGEMGTAACRGRAGGLHAELAGRDPAAAADPVHRRPAHRAGAGGGRAHRAAVRGVRAAHRRTPLGHRHHRIRLRHSASRSSDWRGAPTRCSTEGLVEEVSALLGRGLRDGVTASRALGYAQVLVGLDAGGDGDAAREQTFVGTRRYVRRQRSWFRRDHRVHWIDAPPAGNADAALRAWRHVS